MLLIGLMIAWSRLFSKHIVHWKSSLSTMVLQMVVIRNLTHGKEPTMESQSQSCIKQLGDFPREEIWQWRSRMANGLRSLISIVGQIRIGYLNCLRYQPVWKGNRWSRLRAELFLMKVTPRPVVSVLVQLPENIRVDRV